MPYLFKDELLDELGTLPLGYIPYGGADFGEVAAVAEVVGPGDSSAFYDAWVAAAERCAAQAGEALHAGRRASARALYLRAACFYGTSYRPLFGYPVDERLTAAFRKQTAAFEKGVSLLDVPAEALRVPFEGTTMPAYVVRPQDARADETRPLLICTNGYDATVTDMFFATAVEAARRGYHCLIFDGPGQGEMLIEQGVHLRPDWETVIRAVVDVALTLPNVDASRIALTGWSLGGYLAPRAASGEPRLAACIADPGLFSMTSGFGNLASALDLPPSLRNDVGELPQPALDKLAQMVAENPRLHWSFEQRGYWVNGAADLREYLRSIVKFTLEGRAQAIVCPTLLTMAELDPLGKSAPQLYDALRCPKKLVKFSAAEGAGMHCEQMNRSLLNRVTFDWLDEVLTGT